MPSNQKLVVWLSRTPILHRWLLTRPVVLLLVVLEITLLLGEFSLSVLVTGTSRLGVLLVRGLSRLSVWVFDLGRYVGRGTRTLNLWSTKELEQGR